MRRKLFAQSLREQSLSTDDIDKQYSHAIHIVERNLGVCITEDYPLVKFWNQLDEISWYNEEQRKNQK